MTREELLEKLERYRFGDLAPEERDGFFAQLLENQDLYNVFAERQILTELLTDPGIRRDAQAALAESKPFLHRFRSPNWAWGGLSIILAGIVILVVVSLRVQDHTKRHPEIAGAPGVVRQTPAASKPAPDRSAITQPQPGIGGTRPQQAQTGVFAFLLLPGERGASSENVLRFGPAVRTILFEIPLQEGSSQRYSARLASAVGESISTFSGLTSSRLHRGETGLSILVPSNRLTDGDYIIIVSVGSRHGGENLAGYSFRVIRQR